MKRRILLDIILIISAMALPWYVTAVFAIFCLFLIENFWEIIPIFFIVDAYYGMSLSRFHGVTLVMTLLALVLFSLNYFIRKRLL